MDQLAAVWVFVSEGLSWWLVDFWFVTQDEKVSPVSCKLLVQVVVGQLPAHVGDQLDKKVNQWLVCLLRFKTSRWLAGLQSRWLVVKEHRQQLVSCVDS